MEFAGKTALVVGLARSGISAAKLLDSLGARVIVNDMKSEEEIPDVVKELREASNCLFLLGQQPDAMISQVDFIVISPGVPIDSPFILKANEAGKEVISEVELAYRLCRAPITAITGTNGKTTTTALIGEIFKAAGLTTHVVGNIGVPFTGKVAEIRPDHVVAAEISSFQLEAVHCFRPKVSVILNITEDHLNRHKTMENYIAAKFRVYESQGEGDWVVLNGDDDILSAVEIRTSARVAYFSRKRRLSEGAWIEKDMIVTDLGNGQEVIASVKQIAIPGAHNLENALAAALTAKIMGIDSKVISKVLEEFPGVEHRIERVDCLDGVTFYNDSKGTNPDASIKAIEAMTGPTVLIAGGMDKKSDFTGLISVFKDKVKALVVLGETADIIAESARKQGFENIHKVKSIEEAAEKSFRLSSPGYNVLLSPACASWDMFKDYEERGRIFKEAVKALRR